jgi:hypothetical protein
MVHELAYTPYGGGGYCFSRSEILDMELQDILWHIERRRKARAEDAEGIKRALAAQRTG